MDCSLPGFSVHGIFQVRILLWVGLSFSRGSSQPRDWTCGSCIGRQIFCHGATWESPSSEWVAVLSNLLREDLCVDMYLLKFKHSTHHHHFCLGSMIFLHCFHKILMYMDFAGGPVVKSPSAGAGDRHRFKPWSGKVPHASEHRSPCATATEPSCCKCGSLCAGEPMLCSKRSHCDENPTPQGRVAPTHCNWRKPVCNEDPEQRKINTYN